MVEIKIDATPGRDLSPALMAANDCANKDIIVLKFTLILSVEQVQQCGQVAVSTALQCVI